jgi:aspartate/methionine/tyrosine aminotransferase
MIKPANRTNLVQEYYFSQKLKEIDLLNKQGHNVINLGIGNPDMLPPENALQELVDSVNNPKNHGYQSYKGIPELREAFSQWYENFYDISLDSDSEILPLMGSKEGIMHISMAFLNPGDKVLIPNPGYPTYRSVSLLVGAELVEYDLQQNNNWYPDFEELEKKDLTDVKIMWVNYPNMPTGQPASKEIYQKIVDFGIKHNILICNDNPYSFILNDKYISIFEIQGAKDIALELNSLSKSHNMAGFRVGMVAGNAELISNVLKIKSNMDSGMYKPLQLSAVKALQNGKEWYNTINTEYKKRRELVWKLFDKLGAVYDKKQTGMFVWAKIPDNFNDAIEFTDMILDKTKVFITPGNIFGSNGDKYARISLCGTCNTFEQAIERIEKIN